MNTDISRNRALLIVLLTLIAGSLAGFRNGSEQGYRTGFQKGMNEAFDIAAKVCAERLQECKAPLPIPQRKLQRGNSSSTKT